MTSVSNPIVEESFDFSSSPANNGNNNTSNNTVRRQSSFGLLTGTSSSSSPRIMVNQFSAAANSNAHRLSRALKFPVHRKSFNLRNALGSGNNNSNSSINSTSTPSIVSAYHHSNQNTLMSITPPDSPVLEDESTTAQTTPELEDKDELTSRASVFDKTPTLHDEDKTPTLSTVSIMPPSLRPLSLSLRPLSVVRPLSALQEDEPVDRRQSRIEKKNNTSQVESPNNSDADDDYEEAHQSSSAASSISIDFPFLRAIHSFDANTLGKEPNSDMDPDPATICLSFEESDIALLHSVHSSGWGDATLLSTGQRGWIPTNYFSPYAETKVIPLLSAILNFVVAPKSYPLRMDPAENDNNKKNHTSSLSLSKQQPVFTFSQASITNIITGVRSLLEACGTLTRDTPVVKRSQSIRKFRKSLLTELAILVSLAKQYRNTTDDNVIDKLVMVCYKIVTKSVMFLDVWAVDVNLNEDDRRSGQFDELPSITTSGSILRRATPTYASSSIVSSYEPSSSAVSSAVLSSTNNTTNTNRRGAAAASNENRVSVIFHSQPPYAYQRLDEVNEALTTYLGIFIHRMSVLESDPTSATQILVNTRKSMLACRELLATVECISSKSLPRNRDLENSKDKLFIRIRTLVTAAREVVGETTSLTSSSNTSTAATRTSDPAAAMDAKKISTERLIQNATGCAQSACECVVRCRNILAKIGDFQLPSAREYPDFSDGIIAIPYGEKRRQIPDDQSPASGNFPSTYLDNSQQQQSKSSVLPDIPALSPIISHDSAGGEGIGSSNVNVIGNNSLSSPTEFNLDGGRKFLDIVEDDNGKIRAASLEALINLLTDETKEQDPFLVSTFFLTFRLFSTPQEVIRQLISRYEVDTDENSLSLYQLEDLSSRRVKVFNVVKGWMESHWRQSVDGAIMNEILELSENHFRNILPNANLIINDLASKLTFGDLEDGEPIIPRQISLPSGHQQSAMAAIGNGAWSTPGRSLSRHQVSMLNRVNEVNGFTDDDSLLLAPGSVTGSAVDDDIKSIISTSTWTSSLRVRHSLAGAGSLVNYHGGGLMNNSSHVVSIMDFDPSEIANQLTLMDSQVFCKLLPEELLDQNFTKKKRNLAKSPNVTQMTTMSNQLSAFVGDSILSGDMPAKSRRNLLKQWIKIADRCLELHNFNSVLSIVSALQSVNIMRLKRIWDLLSPKYHQMFQNLKKLLIPDKNFAFYRSKLKEQYTPCIPYLGLYLSDLIFIEEGNAKTRELPSGNPGINLDRYERLTKLIGGLQQFQIPYRLNNSRELQTWLRGEMKKAHQSVSRDVNGLWRRSCIVEPRNS